MKETVREVIREYLGYVATSYWGGILCLVIGILMLRDMIKNPIKSYNITYAHYAGWMGSIMSIGLGIGIIVMKFIGKL